MMFGSDLFDDNVPRISLCGKHCLYFGICHELEYKWIRIRFSNLPRRQ